MSGRGSCGVGCEEVILEGAVSICDQMGWEEHA